MKAIITGGGIGGLSAALCLIRDGWTVEVLEQAPEIAEVGAGIQLGPNATRILRGMGVWERLEPTVFYPEAVEMVVGATGRQVFSIPMGQRAEARWGAPFVQIHRADMVEGLRAEIEATAPGSIRTGAHVTGYRIEGATATAVREGGTATGDILIGADGIRSTIRAQMHGPDRPRFTGNVAWRATVPIDRLGPHAPPPTGRVWAGPGRHAVTTRIRAGQMANFVGVTEQDGWHEEGWSLPGDRDEALAAFGGWSPILTAIIRECETPFRWALCDRPALPFWSDGPVMLLGDACHPMLPSLAQGAAQAIEDAWALAKALKRAASVAAAGAAYFDARHARAARVQRESARNLSLYHSAGRAPGWLVYPVLMAAGRMGPGLMMRQLDWLYGHRG